MKTVKEFFQSVSASCEIPAQRSFWEPTIYGEKPNTYFVWRVSGAESVVDSDDEAQVESQTFAVSVFTKSDDLESVCERIEQAARAEGAYTRRLHFEDYEKDTRYYHGEITVTRYF